MKVRLPHLSSLHFKNSFRPYKVILHENALSICQTAEGPKRKGVPPTVQEKAVIKVRTHTSKKDWIVCISVSLNNSLGLFLSVLWGVNTACTAVLAGTGSTVTV